jgi:hypothetical protein
MQDDGARGSRDETVIVRLHASAPRRIFGMAVLVSLAVVLLYLALWHPPAEMGWRIFLLGFAGFMVWASRAFWVATQAVLVLTADTLTEHSPGGETQLVATIAEVRAVARGALALKPSNGFSLSLRHPAPRAWAPGLWWRLGRKVGVGGVTASPQARMMAETIDGMIAKD